MPDIFDQVGDIFDTATSPATPRGDDIFDQAKELVSDVARKAVTPSPQLLHDALGTGMHAPTVVELYDQGMEGVKDLAGRAIDTVLGRGTASQMAHDFRWPMGLANETVRAGLGLLDFGTTPLGMALPAAKGAPAPVQAGIGAGFAADMAPGTAEAVSEAVHNPNSETVPRAAVQTAMNLLPLAHVGETNRKTKAIAEQRAAGAKQAAAYAEDVPYTDRLSHMSNAELMAERTAASASEVNREIAARQKAGTWDVQEPQAPPLNREQRRATVAVPEKGTPETDARMADARENVAQRLVGKRVAELTPDDFTVVDDLARKGYGSAPGEARAASTLEVAKKPEAAEAAAAPMETEAPQRPTERKAKHSVYYGGETQIQIPGENRSYKAVYTLRHPEDTRASHNAFNFEPDPAYPYKNDRNYSEPRNAERIVKQEAEYEPSYLVNNNPDAVNGPPITDAEGNVLGGNSRFMTQRRVAENRPDSVQAYRAMLEKESRKFGLSPEVTRRALAEGYELHRQIIDEIPDTQKLITDLNKTGTAELTLGERAIADSKRLSQATLDHLQSRIEEQGPEGTLSQAMEGRGGADFINRLMEDGVVTQQEKPRLLNADGSLTAEGKGRVSRLMVARLFEDAQQLDAAAPELKQKLERVVAPLSRVAGRNGWDITPQVRAAVRLLEEARRRDVTVDDLAGQRGLFGAGEYSDEAAAIARKLQGKPTEAARAFRQFAKEADLASEEQPMLGMEPPTAQDAFQAAFGVQSSPRPVGLLDRLDAEGKSASERLRARGVTSGSTVSVNEFLNPETIRDMAVSIAGDVARGVLTLEKLGARLASEYGPKARLMAQKVWNEVQNILKPVGAEGFGEHGPVFRSFARDERGATEKLVELQSGDARSALYHPEIGSIDLIWGREGTPSKNYSDGYGLSHILIKHPNVEGRLQEILNSSRVVAKHGNKLILGTDDRGASVGLEFNQKQKTWLVTTYDDSGKAPTAEGLWTSQAPAERAVGLTPPTEGASTPIVQPNDVPVKSSGDMLARGADLISEGKA
ncbi:MAG TPA: hypothetical protein PLZ95_10980, partial [Bryobacteraceae bacterium]|nr:hypothetical protein [Bryobacteraceae bacterium]